MAQTIERMAIMLEQQVDLLKSAGLDDVAVEAAARARHYRLVLALQGDR